VTALFPLSAVDLKYLGASPIVVTMRLGELVDPERLYAALGATVACLPDYSSCVTQRGDDYFLERRKDFFRFSFRVERASSVDRALDGDSFDFNDLAGYLDDAPAPLESPLLSVALTHLESGSLLSLAASHVVGDGESVKILMLVLFRLLQGRALPQLASQRGPATAYESAQREIALPAASYRQHAHGGQRVARSGNVFVERLQAGEMQRLQTEYKDFSRGNRCTCNDIMSALLIRKYFRPLLRGALALQLKIPVNVRSGRQRLNVAYVGNAYQSARICLSRDELERCSLNELIARVHAGVAEVYAGTTQASPPPAQRGELADVVITNAGDLEALLREMDGFAPRNVMVTSSDANAFVVQQIREEHQAYLHLDAEHERGDARP